MDDNYNRTRIKTADKSDGLKICSPIQMLYQFYSDWKDSTQEARKKLLDKEAFPKIQVLGKQP